MRWADRLKHYPMSSPILPYTLSPLNLPTRIETRQFGVTDASRSLKAIHEERYVVTDAPRDTVAIFGGGTTLKLMPWDDPTIEIWALNNFWNRCRDSAGHLRADRWWEMHQITPDASGRHAGEPIQDPHDLDWIRTCPVPLYTVEPVPENPMAIRWPVERMAAKYRDFYSCTFAYQICQAIDEGFAEIQVYGLDLWNGTQRETTVERAAVSYWLGVAEGKGIRVVIPTPDDPHDLAGKFTLGHWGRYGYEYWDEADASVQYVGTLSKREVAV